MQECFAFHVLFLATASKELELHFGESHTDNSPPIVPFWNRKVRSIKTALRNSLSWSSFLFFSIHSFISRTRVLRTTLKKEKRRTGKRKIRKSSADNKKTAKLQHLVCSRSMGLIYASWKRAWKSLNAWTIVLKFESRAKTSKVVRRV